MSEGMGVRRRNSYVSRVVSPVVWLSFVLWVVAALCVPLQVFGQGAASRTLPAKTASEKASMPTKAPALETPEAISIPDIAAKVTEATNLLRDMKTRSAPTPAFNVISSSLPEKGEQLGRQLRESKTVLDGSPTLSVIQRQLQLWQQTQININTWLQILTERATLLKSELDQLQNLEQTWVKTLNTAKTAKAPQPIIQQIQNLITAISAEKKPLEEHNTAVLVLQSNVARALTQCNAMLAVISEAQKNAVGSIFLRDGVPVWSPSLWTHLATTYPKHIRETFPAWRKDFSLYLGDPAMGLPLHAGVFIILLVMFSIARRRVHQREIGEEEKSATLMVFEKPLTAALICSLGFASGPYSVAPMTVKVFFEILMFAPMIRLIKPVVDPRVLPEMYTLWALFATDAMRQGLPGGPFSGQFLLIVESMVGAAALLWLLVYGNIRQTSIKVGDSLWANILRTGTILVLITISTGFLAGSLGYLRLARILVSEVIAGGALIVGLYAVVWILIGMVALILRVWPMRCLNMVINHRGYLERRAHHVLVLIAIVISASRLLSYIGLLGPTLSFFEKILALKLERGSVSISVEDIIVFFLTVWAAYLLSALLRFVLQEDVYPHINIQKGLAYATSSLINYVILALGFVIGLGAIGVSLTKMTVLAGAFGVGIGFGLQSIVNNFVSGLILLFERPIHVGDSIEMDGLIGEVKRIGIRASTVRTWHGSDIVVPNADLVTKQVTNWTLSDKLRRIDLPIGVNYGADPEEVIRMFEGAARAHPDVLKSPASTALFTGYGDSSINFELRAWTDKFNDWPRIRSDLATAIYHAGYEAGISFPFPQRDVRIINDSGKGQSGGNLPGRPNRPPEGGQIKESEGA